MFLTEKDRETVLPTPERASYVHLLDKTLYGIAANKVFYMKNNEWYLSACRSINEFYEMPIKALRGDDNDA